MASDGNLTAAELTETMQQGTGRNMRDILLNHLAVNKETQWELIVVARAVSIAEVETLLFDDSLSNPSLLTFVSSFHSIFQPSRLSAMYSS